MYALKRSFLLLAQVNSVQKSDRASVQSKNSRRAAVDALEEQKLILAQIQRDETRVLDQHRSVKTTRQRLEHDLAKIRAEVEAARYGHVATRVDTVTHPSC